MIILAILDFFGALLMFVMAFGKGTDRNGALIAIFLSVILLFSGLWIVGALA